MFNRNHSLQGNYILTFTGETVCWQHNVGLNRDFCFLGNIQVRSRVMVCSAGEGHAWFRGPAHGAMVAAWRQQGCAGNQGRWDSLQLWAQCSGARYKKRSTAHVEMRQRLHCSLALSIFYTGVWQLSITAMIDRGGWIFRTDDLARII